jgi:hypothetical protein
LAPGPAIPIGRTCIRVQLEDGYANVEVELDGALYKMVRNVLSPRPAKRRRKGGRWGDGRAEAIRQESHTYESRALICVFRASAAAILSY